jgi:hypothetical protein
MEQSEIDLKIINQQIRSISFNQISNQILKSLVNKDNNQIWNEKLFKIMAIFEIGNIYRKVLIDG